MPAVQGRIVAVPARLPGGGTAFMTLLQPSFRGRLRLFFAVIVVIPMVAVVIVLFQLLDATDSVEARRVAVDRRRRTATNLYETKREDAMVAARAVAG